MTDKAKRTQPIIEKYNNKTDTYAIKTAKMSFTAFVLIPEPPEVWK